MTGRFVTSLVITVALSFGCSKNGEVKANLQTFNSERTPEKLIARGKAFAAVGDTTRAEEYYAAALDAGAADKDVVPLLLEVCVRDQRYRAAIEYARSYVERHPDDIRGRYILGTLYQAVGDGKSARSELEVVVSKAPEQADPHFALALVLRDDERDLVAAEGQFREYLRLAPNGAHAEEARASLMRVVP
jgi:tetratricopeptide (TPR) repeat protein